MPLHHAVPAPSFLAVPPQPTPAAHGPAAGAASFAVALQQAGAPKPPTVAGGRRNAATQAKDGPAASPTRSTKHAAIEAASGASQGWTVAQPTALPSGLPAQSASATDEMPQARPTPAGGAEGHAPCGEAAAPHAAPATPAVDQPAAPRAESQGQTPVLSASYQPEAAFAPGADPAGTQTPPGKPGAALGQPAPRNARAAGGQPQASQIVVEIRPEAGTPTAQIGTQILAAHATMQADPPADEAAAGVPDAASAGPAPHQAPDSGVAPGNASVPDHGRAETPVGPGAAPAASFFAPAVSPGAPIKIRPTATADTQTARQPQRGEATAPIPAEDAGAPPDDGGGAPISSATAATNGPPVAKHDATTAQPRQARAEKTAAAPDGAQAQTPAASLAAAAAANAPAPEAGAQPATNAIQAATSIAQAAAPGGTPPPPAPGAPAAQIAQGLSALHMTGAGARQVTIHLTPGTLGAVQVRIERGTDGAATVTLLAEKAETLHALQQDSAHLHEALDRAGLPNTGRQVSYELAQGQATTGSGGGGFGAGQGGAGGQHGQRGGQAGQPQAPGYPRAGSDAPSRTIAQPPRSRATAASGINITA